MKRESPINAGDTVEVFVESDRQAESLWDFLKQDEIGLKGFVEDDGRGYELSEKDEESIDKHCLTAMNHLVNGLGYIRNDKEEPRDSAIIAAYYELEQLITQKIEDSENYTGG